MSLAGPAAKPDYCQVSPQAYPGCRGLGSPCDPHRGVWLHLNHPALSLFLYSGGYDTDACRPSILLECAEVHFIRLLLS